MSDGLCSSVDRTNERMNERTNDRASTVTLAHAPRVNNGGAAKSNTKRLTTSSLFYLIVFLPLYIEIRAL